MTPKGFDHRPSANRRWCAFIFVALAGLFANAYGEVAAVGDVPVESAGGEIQVRWNASLLEALDLKVGGTKDRIGVTETGFDRFELRADSNLAIVRHGRSLTGTTSGTLYVRGGYQLTSGQTAISLNDFLLTSATDKPRRFEIQTISGERLFYADNVMAETADAGHSAAIRTMDLRIAPTWAEQLGKPEIAGWQIATLRTLSHVVGPAASLNAERCPASTKWTGMPVPGHPGQTYRTDVFMRQFDVQLTGCKGCTGPGGKGLIKITPTTLLQNNVNDGEAQPTVPNDPQGTSSEMFSADVPWREMFSKNCPPYNNDQHPYLTWNLYRINAAGLLDQLARSGVKHGHIAENGSCSDNPGDNHILGRGCTDAYGSGDNDVPEMLGPRSEIIPFTGQWGRCGSIYDPQCKGERHFTGYDDYSFRALVSESEIDPEQNPGAKFYVEAWYVVRDDINPYNSMATVPVKAQWHANSRLWSVITDGDIRVGSMVDRWLGVDLADRMTAKQEILTPSGRLKLAVVVTALGEKRYRYDYTVMNVDYAAAKTRGQEPNLKIISTHGLTSFRIPSGARTDVKRITFIGNDRIPEHQWSSALKAGYLTWCAPAGAELTWGTLFHFSFEADRAPTKAAVNIGTPMKTYSTTLLAPE